MRNYNQHSGHYLSMGIFLLILAVILSACSSVVPDNGSNQARDNIEDNGVSQELTPEESNEEQADKLQPESETLEPADEEHPDDNTDSSSLEPDAAAGEEVPDRSDSTGLSDPDTTPSSDNGQADEDRPVEDPGDRKSDEAYESIREKYDINDPSSIAVLVNKTYGLPESYEPDDLVKVDIPFVYQDESVHSLRKIAAEAVQEMFEASKEDGIELAGVSGYRSHAIQKILYDNYVKRDGEEAANRYSAKPGHSEHSTGLAMDVAGISGKCAANNCFAGTEEAEWVAEHAHEFGFIIRYPEGKEDITGYQYEPWHLRYVGKELAEILKENDWTLEEFFLQSDQTPA